MQECQKYKRNSAYWRPSWIDKGRLEEKEYQNDWRDYLNDDNCRQVSTLIKLGSSHRARFLSYSRKTVEFFLWVATGDFGLAPEIAYLAVDIFDRFWVENRNHDEFDEGIENICLISLSCIQIASKLICSNQMVSISSIMEWMKNVGYEIEKKKIVSSEITVFKTVKWTMPNLTILSYVEMFLEDMMEMLAVRPYELLQVCIKVANVSIMFHSEIYLKFHCTFKKRAPITDSERSEFISVEGDLVRLAASIVHTSAMLFDPTNLLANDMIAYLVKTTRYTESEIKVLSHLMMNIILRHNAVSPP